MKKRTLIFAMVLCLAAAFCLTGCGSSQPYSKYDLSEYVELGKYTGLEREEINVSVSSTEVEAEIETRVAESASYTEVTEGTVKEGDTVNIDYVGTLDGVAFEGGSAEGYELEIGSDSFIEGFEDGLIGVNAGETVDLNLTFPVDYGSADLAGQAVVFEVTVNSIKVKEVPEFNNKWVKNNSDVKTTEEYRIVVEEELLEQREYEAKTDIINGLWTQVVEDSKIIKYPEKELEQYIEDIEEQYEATAESYGLTLEDLLAAYAIDDMEVFNEQNKIAAKAFIKDQMVLYYIAQKEGLTYTDEMADQMEEEILASGYTDETFKEYFGQDIDSYIDSALTFQVVTDFIFEKSVVKK